MNTAQRRYWDEIKADRDLIDRAATWLRHDATQDAYAGFRNQEAAYSLAALLDVVALHLPDVEDAVRRQTVRTCRTVLNERVDRPQVRRTRTR